MLPLMNAFTALLNHWFGAFAVALLLDLGIHPAHPKHIIGNDLALQLVVMFCSLVFFVIARFMMSVEKPGAIQHTAEWFHEFVSGQAEQIIGPTYEHFMPFVTTIFIFVLFLNCFGLLPGFESPTSDPTVPLGIALLTFVYYNWHGVRKQGIVKYIKHFGGPAWWIAPLLFPIEIISHFARIMSLTVRLYANMLASDMLTLAFFSLIPFAVPVIFLGFHFGESIIQAYIFMLLAMIYLSEAVTHDETSPNM